MRNQLSGIILVSYSNCVLPTKSDIHNKIMGSNSMHLCCFKFFSLGYIGVKSPFCMATYP